MTVDARELGIEPLPAARISAFRRPGVVLVYHAHRLLLSLLLAVPLAAALVRAVRHRPEGELALLEPGGVLLIEAGRFARATLDALGTQAVVLAAVWTLAGLVPLAWLLHALGHAGPARPAHVAARIARSLGTLAILFTISAGATLLCVAIFVVLAAAIVERLGLVPPSTDFVRATVLSIGAVGIALVGIVHDLARAAAVDERRGLYHSLRIALVVVARRPVAAIWGWAWRAAVAAAVVAAAFAIAGPFGPPASLLAEITVRHGALLVVTCLRASWLATALRLVASARRAHQPDASS